MTTSPSDEELNALAARYRAWLFDTALPLWWHAGADHQGGGFHELLDLSGRPVVAPRRARVQGRQSYVYSMAGQTGWQGPWQAAGAHGLAYLNTHYRTPSGLYCTLVTPEGTIADGTIMNYDQAFALLAMAWCWRADPRQDELVVASDDIVARLRRMRGHAAGGFVEAGAKPFQSNPHMHLLEAALAWSEFHTSPTWRVLAGEIVALCLSRFIDRDGGYLREFFDETWAPAPGADGHVVEPGHQFEWAWLLERWSRLSGDGESHAAAVKLYECGARGVNPSTGAAVDEMNEAFDVTRAGARLWPQTERVKAALILAESGDRARYHADAVAAAKVLWTYLETPVPGLWRDKFRPDGTFLEEPAPASSLYHIACAIESLTRAAAV
jgi:mannose-6-phosphate isomerase